MLSLASPDAETNEKPVAEVWAVYEDNPVSTGVFAGYTLDELVAEYANEILGAHVATQGNKRFPLLIKLLDCASWLSLQVHPNDEQAWQLEGSEFMGKTEAWHILNAQSDAQLIAGIKPKTSTQALHAAIGNERILDLVEYHNVQTNDTIFMPAGTIHALGPGLLVYEVQQTSDLTYRVFDWDRPQTNGRVLHIEKSIAVTNPQSQGKISRKQDSGGMAMSSCEVSLFSFGDAFHTPGARYAWREFPRSDGDCWPSRHLHTGRRCNLGEVRYHISLSGMRPLLLRWKFPDFVFVSLTRIPNH